MTVKTSWYGEELVAKMNTATARAVISVGEHIAVETKRVTHVMSGNLRRSVHTAPKDYDGSGDEGAAGSGDMMMAGSVNEASIQTSEGPMLEVGSWLPYACAEWVGRGHPGIEQGVEMVRGERIQAIFAQSFTEAGL